MPSGEPRSASKAMDYVRGSVTVTTTVDAAGMIAVADGE
jgi:hypothetical protein